MIVKHVLAVSVAIAFTSLLAACGPGNTLYSSASPAGNKALEAAVRKNQEALKLLEQHQLQLDARIAALQKRLGVPAHAPEAKPTIPQSSALGIGFARPGAGASPKTPPAPPVAEPTMAPPANGQSASPAGMPATAPAAAPAQSQSPHPSVGQPPAGKGFRGSRVGSTPEAAIAADRAQAPAPAPLASPAAGQPARAATTPAPKRGVVGDRTDKAAPQAAPPTPSPNTPASATEKTAYNNALQLAINGHQEAARAAFEQFLAAHPHSALAPNALYWVGEGAYQRGDYNNAAAEFGKVVNGWPGHDKAADALYKMALAQEKSGDTAAARKTLERYLTDYPTGALAGTARQKLQALPK